MNKFKLYSEYKSTLDQNKAIKKLVCGLNDNSKYQVLLGVTGSGKTYTLANVIENIQRPTLVISHNKTLAAQLYQEFKSFFPKNAVSYFVSYYDYYQPEAYIPSTDTYIEKDADINDLIDKLRLATTTNLLTRNDNIVVASVSCIYNIGSPKEYGNFVFEFFKGEKIFRNQIIQRLIDLQYERSEFGFHRGSFRVRGDKIDIYPAYQDEAIRIVLENSRILNIQKIEPISGNLLNSKIFDNFVLYPSKHYITDPNKNKSAINLIKKDLKLRIDKLISENKHLEALRLKQKVNYDLEMLQEVGYVKGIENYSRYFDGRKIGEPPFTLIDYLNYSSEKYYSKSDNWLLIVDESHMTFPQIRGMYAGDQSRKETLIDYGFRLPSALDNRPLKFDEFIRKIPNFIASSATPSDWEINMAKESSSKNNIVQQLIRPTGIPDPNVTIKPSSSQIKDIINELKILKRKNQRALITTLTKKTAEDLSLYLEEQGIKVNYLHSDIKTLERTDILDNLRKGIYDCIVGVNLLREGLDLPEVSLVAILDADKEGFLRSEKSMIQTMGRAARHKDGKVILYADIITNSIKNALHEIKRRRKYQINYNKKHNIIPKSINKPFREKLIENDYLEEIEEKFKNKNKNYEYLLSIDNDSLTPSERKRVVNIIKNEMKIAADNFDFELAIALRDKIKIINS